MQIITSNSQFNLIYAAQKLVRGSLVAFPTETVYGLGADAMNKSAIASLYRAKGRPVNHPLIVHISSIEYLDIWTKNVPKYALDLARLFWPGPLTLVLPRSKVAKDFITGGQDFVAVRVPNQPIAKFILKEFEQQGGLGVAAPSANRFGKVSPTNAKAVIEDLGDWLTPSDLVIDGGKCQIGIESTIIKCETLLPTILRPGAITKKHIEEAINISVTEDITANKVRAAGLLQNHYAPNAKVVIDQKPQKGDGLIALSDVETPPGVIRIAMPNSNIEYARQLYDSFRMADELGLQRIIAIKPIGQDISVAINDRLQKASNTNVTKI
jgi:L-threonylcarbamoyladenylate synthase